MPVPSRSSSSRSTSSRRAWSLSASSRGRHARRRTAPRRAVTALGAVAAATAVPVLTAGAASAASAGDWQRLAMCESTGNWHINTGNGYYGGLQFSSSTWLAFGGGGYAPRADLASPEQQMAIANRVLAAQGWNAWPVCSRKVGLYGTPTTPAPPPPAPMVVGAIASHFYALGGVHSVLGAPTSYELGSIRGGRYNFFQNGAMYWTAARGAWEVHGAVRARWQALGSEHSWLGYPTSDEYRTPVRVGADSTFEGGMVYWSPATGAHEMRGAILQAWKRQGWENGALGFPVTGERPTVRPGAISRFEGGSIAWSLPTGAHATQGAIDARWRSLGADASRLGLPTSNEYSVPGGRRSDFQGGSIVWTVTGGAVVRPR